MFTEEEWIMAEEEFFNSLQEVEDWGDDDEEFLEEWGEDVDYYYGEDELNFEKD